MATHIDDAGELSLAQLAIELEDLESDGDLDTVQHYTIDAGFIFVTKGSARVLVRMQAPNASKGTMDDVPSGAEIIRISTEAVSGLSKLTPSERLLIYEQLGAFAYNCSSARIDEDGVLILATSLTTTNLSLEYCATFIADFADFVDKIDTDLAKQWDGLTNLDEGPASEQGRTNHAEY
jgi:hypothetical protein